ncbi:hypothetical protein [Xanthomonas phage RTH11]|nr:hypothetical protein [Xanthomonas phage RTH11]
MEKDNKVVHFNHRLINKSAGDLVDYLKYLGAPGPLQTLVFEAAKDHFEMNKANGEITFKINTRMMRGACELRMGTDVFEGKESEDEVLPLVFISSSMMHMGHYSAVAGLEPHDIDDWEKTDQFFKDHLHWLLDAAGAHAPGTGMNEAFAFASCFLMNLMRNSSQVYMVEEKTGTSAGTRHYFGLADHPESEEDLEFISITFTAMGIEHDKKRNLRIARAKMPSYAPMWTNEEEGTIKATLTMHKESSPLFKGQKPHVWEEIIGTDRKAMEAHIRSSLKWLAHYGLYFNTEGWEYNVKWGTHKPKKKRE